MTDTSLQPPPTPDAPHVVLIGVCTFNWLKALQVRAPSPRMDLRYWIEGALDLLKNTPHLHDVWQGEARNALMKQLLDASDGGEREGGRHRAGTGTGGRQAAEGAHAREPDRGESAKHDECKALQIGDDCFKWLKRIQDTTKPRLEMRFLLEGAAALLQDHTELLPVVVSYARSALARHMAHLKDEPVPPFSFSETKQCNPQSSPFPSRTSAAT